MTPTSRKRIFVYFVYACNGSLRGCASWKAPPEIKDASGLPVARPSVVVASCASPWTLAHECGHILGLSHVSADNFLMYDTTSSLSKDPPDLTGQEGIMMQRSQFTQ